MDSRLVVRVADQSCAVVRFLQPLLPCAERPLVADQLNPSAAVFPVGVTSFALA